MRFLALPFLVALSSFASAAGKGDVIGDVRVQVLSSTLIRLEVKGPKGFEDRPTFHVVNRKFPGAETKRKVVGPNVQIEGLGFRVLVPQNAHTLEGIQITDLKGKVMYTYDKKQGNSVWMPGPASKDDAWSFADTPRVIPSKAGLVPYPSDNGTSGWDVGNDAPDVYVFLLSRTYQNFREDFLQLTGPTEMPPLFGLGYVDSKYFAYHEADALARIQEYRRRQIPLDMFVVDTDWRLGGSHGYVVDPQYFPDMPRFLKAAHGWNVKVMFNDHPEPASKLALDPAELKRRYDGLTGMLKDGVDVWWYDRNWNVGLVPPAPNLAKEVWGMKLYHDITQAYRPNQRPLIMSNVDGIDNGIRNRPPDVAAHRYPVQWTGDTSSKWIYLQRGVQNAVDEGVEGLNPWINEDLGGHVGSPTPEVYIRYLQYGSVAPMMRVHCTKGQTREPWAFGPDAEKIVPDYIRLRYRLLPLLYASAREAYETGMPVLRRCDLAYTDSPDALRNDQFLLGDGLLVAPIISGQEDAAIPSGLLTTPSGQPGLQAEYFANQDLKGAPALKRVDPNIDFEWHYGSPSETIPADHWSARWTGKIGPIPGDKPYRLSITGDDGVRVWIDGKLVVDKWVDQDSVMTRVPINLDPGKSYDLKVEFYDNENDAVCKLRFNTGEKSSVSEREVWVPPGTWTNLWTGERIEGPKKVMVKAELAQMPMFARAGAIVPLAPEMQYTGEKPWTPITLEIFPGAEAQQTLYEDDGISNGYQNKAFRKTDLHMLTQHPQGTVQESMKLDIAGAQGDYPNAPSTRSWTCRFHLGAATTVQKVEVDGKEITGWKLLKQNGSTAMPLMGTASARDGQVLEVVLPMGPVSTAHHIRVATTLAR